jgi:hypothetical protein
MTLTQSFSGADHADGLEWPQLNARLHRSGVPVFFPVTLR